MPFLRRLVRGLRALGNRKATDQDLADETQNYFDEQIAAFIAAGLTPEEARRRAHLQMGSLTSVREQVRSYGWENLVDTMMGNLRLGWRRLCKNPAFTVVGAVTLALGIGASTAIFSAVNPILFEPLPYPAASRLIMVWDVFQGVRSDVTFHTYRELLERCRSFSGLAVADVTPWRPTMTGTARPIQFDGQSVSASYFRVLGISPTLGRDFQTADDLVRGPKAVILGHALWMRRFTGDPTIIGREIRLDDALWKVIGVMPEGFENVLSPATEIWKPLQYDTENITRLDTGEWGHHLKMLGRLRPGFSVVQVKSELDRIAHTPVFEFPRPHWASLQSGFIIDSLQDHVTRGVKPALLAVLGAVLLVLIIASVNVTNLLLARGVRRRGEFAMRAALGARRAQLIGQLLTESMLLSGIGGALGMLVAKLSIWSLVALSPPGLPRVNAIGLNHVAFAFAFGVTGLVGMMSGLIPALQGSRTDLVSGIQQNSSRVAGGHQVARRTLVIVEVALASVLLVGAGLLLRSLQHLFAVAPGFEAAHMLTMQVQIPGHRYDAPGAVQQYVAETLEAVRHVPGVDSAAVSSLLPFGGGQYDTYGIEFEDRRAYDVFRYVISPGYFETMRIPLLRGRLLNEHDTAGSQPVAVISESLAEREFGGVNPIGKRAHIGPLNRPWYMVVGVVGDIKQASLADAQSDAAYITPAQSWFDDDTESFIVRIHGDPMKLATAIQNAIWSVDKDEAIVHIATMEGLLATSVAERHFAMIVFQAFALAALLLAAVGLFGVISGSVNERTHEIGVRATLGASRADILALVVNQGMKLAAFGMVIGLTAAAAATQGLASLLFGVSPLDLTTYFCVIALLLGVSIIASWFPARRAAKLDPSITLRAA